MKEEIERRVADLEAAALTVSLTANMESTACSGADERLFVVADGSCRVLSIPIVKSPPWKIGGLKKTVYSRSLFPPRSQVSP